MTPNQTFNETKMDKERLTLAPTNHLLYIYFSESSSTISLSIQFPFLQLNSNSLSMSGVEERNERKVLVAVDESEESSYALSWCLKNVASADDTIILLHVKPRPAVYTAMDGTGYLFSNDIMATMEKYGDGVANSVMEKSAAMCRQFGELKVEMKIENGTAKDVICKVADKLSPDVLVMGSHGSGRIKRAFMGSVSYHCTHKVKCPVIVVKKPKSAVKN